MNASQWKRTKIGDLCVKVTSGGTPSRNKPEYYTGSIPWIKTGELNGWFINDTSEKITDEAVAKSSAKIYPTNTVLMAMYGDGRTIGSVGITNVAASSNQASCAMIAETEKCYPLYLLYSLQHHRDAIVKLALGGVQRNLNQGTIKNYEILVPELSEQKSIVEVLSTYDNLIENNNRRIAILEEIAQSLYQEWFVKFRYPGHENQKLVDSALGLIPKGWEMKPIAEAVGISGGGTPKKAECEYWNEDQATINWFTPSDLTREGAMFAVESGLKITQLGLQKSSAKLFPAYSVMMTSRATIGVISINTTVACTNQGFIICIPTEIISTEFIYYWLIENMQKINNLATGATFKEVRRSLFKELPFLVPTASVLDGFNATIKSITNLIERLTNKNSNLKKQRDMLLPKLISGKISLN